MKYEDFYSNKSKFVKLQKEFGLGYYKELERLIRHYMIHEWKIESEKAEEFIQEYTKEEYFTLANETLTSINYGDEFYSETHLYPKELKIVQTVYCILNNYEEVISFDNINKMLEYMQDVTYDEIVSINELNLDKISELESAAS